MAQNNVSAGAKRVRNIATVNDQLLNKAFCQGLFLQIFCTHGQAKLIKEKLTARNDVMT